MSITRFSTTDAVGPFPAALQPVSLAQATDLTGAPPSLPPIDRTVVAAARRTLELVLEVWTFRRPVAALASLLDPQAMRYVQVVAWRTQAAGSARSAALRSMRICHPHPEAAEIAAVCEIAGRPRALAARFEREGTWRCRLIHLG